MLLENLRGFREGVDQPCLSTKTGVILSPSRRCPEIWKSEYGRVRQTQALQVMIVRNVAPATLAQTQAYEAVPGCLPALRPPPPGGRKHVHTHTLEYLKRIRYYPSGPIFEKFFQHLQSVCRIRTRALPALGSLRPNAKPGCPGWVPQVGDPLEIKLFQSTGWKLLEGEQGASQESHHNGHHVRVQPALKPSAGLDLLQRFDFTSECARCTVVVRGCTANAATRTFVKGSPEIVRRIVDPASIPADFDAVLNSLTQEGFRYECTPPLPNFDPNLEHTPTPCALHP